MDRLNIIGIGGTDASGKDSVAQMLVDRYGWMYVSVTDILREEARKRGIPIQRNTLRKISSEWRRKHGMGILVDLALKEFKTKKNDAKGLAIASIRHPGEADKVHELGGRIIWTDANPKVRYQRIIARKRGTEDEVSFEQFLTEEKTQMSHGDDDATLNLMGVKARADIFIENNSNDIEAFKDEAEKALNLE